MNSGTFIHLDRISKILLTLPGVMEGLSYGTPGFRVSKKLIARLKEDGETLVVYTEARDSWLEMDPETFYITDHYRKSSYVLVGLDRVKVSDLKAILHAAWKARAGKRLSLRSLE